MKIALDGFQDKEIRATERNMRSSRVSNRTTVDMRGNLGIEKLGDNSNFFGFPDTATAPDIGLQDRHARL